MITLAILAAVAALAAQAVTVIYITVLVLDEVLKWFADIKGKIRNKNRLGFTLKEHMRSGNYRVIQGVFNAGGDRVEASRTIEAKSLGQDLAEIHGDKPLVIYS